MKYRQLLLDFGRTVMRRVRSKPDDIKKPRRNSRLRQDPLLEDFAPEAQHLHLARGNSDRVKEKPLYLFRICRLPQVLFVEGKILIFKLPFPILDLVQIHFI